MSWAVIWAVSAVAGAVFGWLVGPVPLAFAMQLIVMLAEIGGDA